MDDDKNDEDSSSHRRQRQRPRPVPRSHHVRMIHRMMVMVVMMMMMFVRKQLWPPQQPQGLVVVNNYLVAAQATGFCHRPPIKPTFVNEDIDTTAGTSTGSSSSTSLNNNNILVIAHRGASYHIPIEHSRASYRLALELSSHYIETDLAISKDGILFPMHSIDLTMTTNILTSDFVTQQNRSPWFSTYANRSSYWSFNFTFAELQTLTLQQRRTTEPSPTATQSEQKRTNLYDNLFTIPTLEDVVHLLVDWNVNEIPKLHSNKTTTTMNAAGTEPTDPAAESSRIPNEFHDIYKAGLYLEFKDTDWIFAETGYNVVELLFTQIISRLHDTTTTTQYTWKDLFTCYERIRFDQYIIPPLILQSFNHSDLLSFHTLWHEHQVPDFPDPSTTTNQLSTIAPEPLYVVLVDAPQCYDDTFWYTMSNDQYRSFVNGIGCHKNCILPLAPTGSSDTSPSSSSISEQEMIQDQHEHIEAIMERITELQMVLHVWTERPEISYLNPMFRTVMDEIYYLKCNVSHVHGIFTESVDMAFHALQIPCPTTTTTTGTTDTNTGTNTGVVPQTAICQDNHQYQNGPTSMAVGILSFLLGVIVAMVMQQGRRWYHHHHKSTPGSTNNGSNSYQHATTIITNDEEDDDDDNVRNGFNDNDKNQGLELSIT